MRLAILFLALVQAHGFNGAVLRRSPVRAPARMMMMVGPEQLEHVGSALEHLTTMDLAATLGSAGGDLDARALAAVNNPEANFDKEFGPAQVGGRGMYSHHLLQRDDFRLPVLPMSPGVSRRCSHAAPNTQQQRHPHRLPPSSNVCTSS